MAQQIAYIRVSTEKQNYDRQYHTFNEYFKSRGIDPSQIRFVNEKITSHTKFTERKIYQVLSSAQPGDIIYACQLDRFGRTVQDVLDLVDFAMKKGVELITLDGHTLENKTPMGRMMLTMLAAYAEMERSLRAERCQAGHEAAREEIRRNGSRISRVSGRIQTKIGNPKGVDMSAAVQAAVAARAERVIQWRETSPAFQWVKQKLIDGWSRRQVIEEFNKLHELQPDVFCTTKGKLLTRSTLCRWIQEAGLPG